MFWGFYLPCRTPALFLYMGFFFFCFGEGFSHKERDQSLGQLLETGTVP
jgi:hypothetical protein